MTARIVNAPSTVCSLQEGTLSLPSYFHHYDAVEPFSILYLVVQ
jgi:hypothetical protein